jgi:hypothetical protein
MRFAKSDKVENLPASLGRVHGVEFESISIFEMVDERLFQGIEDAIHTLSPCRVL